MQDELDMISRDVRLAVRCPVCCGLTVDLGHACENGHVVCRSCVGGLVAANRAESCPTCRGRLDDEDDDPPMVQRMRRLYAELSVSCANRSYGCQVVEKLWTIGRHEARCQYSRPPKPVSPPPS